MSYHYLKKIIAPISIESPVGDRLYDDAVFDFVEAQLMKVGSLSHGEVQWGEVESGVVMLLETRSKDLKLITYLMQCLQYQSCIERFTLSLASLNEFMKSYWETCFPAPGAIGVLPRRKYFTKIMQFTLKAGENLDCQSCEPKNKEQLLTRLTELVETTLKFELPIETLERLKLHFIRQFEKNESNTPKLEVVQEPGRDVVVPKLEIDSSNDKATKQTLFKLADFVSESETGMELALKIRRFATWFSVTSIPENADDEGETSLMPIARDRVSEYFSQLERGADLALLRRVETSLTLSPFWLDGHYLSARIAIALGQSEWADAIHKETTSFVSRLPKLINMSFKGGVPFASSETKSWLDKGDNGVVSASEGQGWEGQANEVLELAESGGLAMALVSLNEFMQQASEPRDCFYLRLLGADLKSKHQLAAMADIDYRILYEQANNMALADWEPRLMASLKQKSNLN